MLARFSVIAGASRGIGRAMALSLAHKGDRVFAGARSVAELESLAEEAREAGCAHLIEISRLDVTSAASTAAFFARAHVLAGGGIDVLVVCAGTARLGGLCSHPEEVADMAQTNFVGSFNCMHFARSLLAERRGIAVLMISRAARACYPQTLAYGATKAAVAYLVQAAARELAPVGVCVIGLSPGAVATPMRQALFPHEDPRTIMDPPQVAAAVIALLDERLRGATGSIVDFPW